MVSCRMIADKPQGSLPVQSVIRCMQYAEQRVGSGTSDAGGFRASAVLRRERFLGQLQWVRGSAQHRKRVPELISERGGQNTVHQDGSVGTHPRII